MTRREAASTYLPLLLAVFCVSFGSILVRLARAPSLTVAFFRMGLAASILAPFGAAALRRSWPDLPPRRRAALLASGVALALHFATWIGSLSFTSVAASVLLVNLAPVFNLILSRAFLGERATAATLAALALALAGAGLIAAEDGASSGSAPLKGALLALIGAVALSVHHVVGRGLRNALPLRGYVFGVWSTAAVVLGLLAAGTGAPLLGYSPGTYGLFLALALVPTLAGHGLENRALRMLPAPDVGLFFLGEPLCASIFAYLLFGEAPGARTLVGGGVVLAALVVLVLGEQR